MGYEVRGGRSREWSPDLARSCASPSQGRLMEIDATTLSDLEVFLSADGSDGLFALIDRTATESGRKALHRRLQHPISDAHELRHTQEAVRFFIHHPRLLRVERDSLAVVQAYLGSNIELNAAVPLGSEVEYLWMAVRYRDVLKEIGQGVRGTVALFSELSGLGRVLDEHAPPSLIARLAADLQAAAAAVLRARATVRNPLRLDRLYRGTLRDEIRRALDAVAELDALNAMASSTAALGWTMPDVVESDTFLLDAADVVHPFVKDPVPNPVHLSGGGPMVFLTGPNMAGKTTYLRSIALVVFLAHVGMGVPATRARFTPVEVLFTSLNPSDNLKAGVSYFLAEVLRVKAAASFLADGRRTFVLFDEVFKGTNVKDALEASAEVITGFAKARTSGFVFSSHLVELVDVLGSTPSIRFCCFDGEIVSGALRYSYELKEGVSDKRLGLLLLREARIPELIARISA
jgi:DNA mismatch repair protein MutS